MQKIVLASASPRRKQLLEWADQNFEVIVSNSPEEAPGELSPSETAIYIARQKALAVLKKLNENIPVLAADTIVVCKGRILGKPKDREEAIYFLQLLSGTHHTVTTGVVIRYGEKEISFADETIVSFHSLNREQIEFYVDHYKPYDKAGAYAIQEWIGVIGIKAIKGDFYNVMGLPVSRVMQALASL
ncbi:MAG: septum formation protein Maf [Niastella sp.]|nr:septum formation protein Maf [Niastella sp.]